MKPSPSTHEADVADFIGLLSSQALEQYAQTEDQKAYWVHQSSAFYFFVSRCWQAKLQGNDPFIEGVENPALNHRYYGIKVRSHSEINSPELTAYSEVNSPELTAYSEINSPELAAYSVINSPELTAQPKINSPELAAESVINSPELAAQPKINSPELTAQPKINSPELTAQPKINSPELKRKRPPKGTR